MFNSLCVVALVPITLVCVFTAATSSTSKYFLYFLSFLRFVRWRSTHAILRNASVTPPLIPETFVDIVPRDAWGARPPTSVANLTTPVPFVVIHHSYLPAACYDFEDCVEAMRWMQDLHQLTNDWDDIGYNFGVGSDGRAYEGRGWNAVGAHSPVYNAMSIGICLIGDWRELLPPKEQLETAKQLIKMGIETGIIRDDYELVGHRMVRYGTECPGDRLLNEISEWAHFPTEEEAENLYVYYP